MSATMLARGGTSPLVLFGAIILLAGLDFLGAVFAKGWVEQHNRWLFLAGLVAFVLLFAIYALSLGVAELSTVTFGWIVCLQVGLVVFERVRYAVQIPTGKAAAMVAIIALQAYLVLAPSGQPGAS
jgi:hypothetical protein